MKIQRAQKFKFVKGQTIFLTETDFGISVTKMQVLELIPNHKYTYLDPWGDDEYCISPAIRVKIDENEKILPIKKFDLNAFVSTSSRNALKIVKTFSNKVDHYQLVTKSYFFTEWT